MTGMTIWEVSSLIRCSSLRARAAFGRSNPVFNELRKKLDCFAQTLRGLATTKACRLGKAQRSPTLIRWASLLAAQPTVLLLMIFLTSCSHHIRRDGPPNFYVDETSIPNAVPKPEPLAKYGNMNSYVVFGKRYYRLKSSQDYQAVGIASWYGTQFHTHHTSSGERYNMLAMTAAHKTLPLPTYVEVTNLKNRRTIIVKVNDRGPFASNRIIDLSYVAAKKLGMLGHGTALVKIKAINPYTFGRDAGFYFASRHVKSLPPATSSWQASNNNSVYFQVGAFRNKVHAQRLQQRLINLLATPVKVAMPTDQGKLYRVQVGPFKDMYAANRISDRLKELGIKSNKLTVS